MNKHFRKYLLSSTLLQLFLLLASSTILDGGRTSVAFVYSSAGYWTGVIFIRHRKRKRKNRELCRSDVYYLKYGLPILCMFGGVLLVPFIWSLRGY